MNKFNYLQQYDLYLKKIIRKFILFMTNILYVTKSIIKSFFNVSECQK